MWPFQKFCFVWVLPMRCSSGGKLRRLLLRMLAGRWAGWTLTESPLQNSDTPHKHGARSALGGTAIPEKLI